MIFRILLLGAGIFFCTTMEDVKTMEVLDAGLESAAGGRRMDLPA